MTGKRWLLAATTAAALLFFVSSASAATFTVDSTGEEPDLALNNGVCRTAANTCTLRAALQEANSFPGADTILVPPGNYSIATWAPQITQSVTIRGTGVVGETRFESNMTANNWPITGGGNVTLERVTITGVFGAAAVYVNGPDVTLREVMISDNQVGVSSPSGLNIFSGNVELIRSSIIRNQVISTSNVNGGGVGISSGSLKMVATTIAENRISTMAAQAYGGGLFVGGSAQVTLDHVTMTNNSVSSGSGANSGGNLYVGVSSDVTIRDSIISAGQSASGQGQNCSLLDGATALKVAGKNIYEPVGSSSCIFPAGTVASEDPGVLIMTPWLGGGVAYVPLDDSPAIDAASGCPQGGLDQRLGKVPAGPKCDIGSVEAAADLRLKVSAAPGPVPSGNAVMHTAVVTNEGPDNLYEVNVNLTSSGQLSSLWASHGICSATGKCELGNLLVGSSKVITFVAKAPQSGTLTVSTAATGSIPDPSPADAKATVTTLVTDTRTPVINRLRAVGTLRTGKKGRIVFNLNRDAQVKIIVSRPGKGGRAKKIGVLRANGKAGKVTVSFPARLGGRKLAPGSYRLSATATAPGALPSKTATATIKVIKAKKKSKK